MNNIFENKLSMYQKVQGYLNNHSTETSSIPSVATLKSELDNEVNTLQGYAADADRDNTGHTVDKQMKRNALRQSLLKLSTAVVAYAAITENYALLEKCDENLSTLDKMRDNDFYTYSSTVLAEVNPIVADLADYGVQPTDITQLTNDQTVFLTAIQDPRLQINESSTALEQLAESFATIDALLKNKLDKVMMVFITTNPVLYNGYKGARSIDDDGTGQSTPDYDKEVAPGRIELIANIPYSAGRQFRFQNNGANAINFSLSTNDTEMQGAILNLAPNSENQRLSNNLNESEKANYLLVENTGETTATYKIWITE